MDILFAIFVILFVAQSYTEYKLVSQVPWFARNFHGLKASIISAGISFAMGAIAGATIGKAYTLPFILAGVIGAATNEQTYKFWSWVDRTNTRVHHTRDRWRTMKAERPQFVQDVATGVKAIAGLVLWLFACIGKFVRFLGWLAGIPERVQRWLHRERNERFAQHKVGYQYLVDKEVEKLQGRV
jgi:hypothetical protein